MARADWAFADCRTVAVSGNARSDAPLPEGRIRSGGALRARLHRERSAGARHRSCRDARYRLVLSSRGTDEAARPIRSRGRHAAVAIGDSQSGNFIKTFVHLGFNQDRAGPHRLGRRVSRIAARQTPMNFRFALPGGAATLYEPGSEPRGVVERYATRARPCAGEPSRSLPATNTCPKVIEAFGSTEFWGLRMSPDLIGTDAEQTFRCPTTCAATTIRARRTAVGAAGSPSSAGRRSGRCALPANPNPEADTTRALTRALSSGSSRARRRRRADIRGSIAASSSPRRIRRRHARRPGLPFGESPVNPVLDYDFGPDFSAERSAGVMSRQPPRIVRVIPTFVPAVNATATRPPASRPCCTRRRSARIWAGT